MKWLHRTILNTAAYQRSWRTNATNRLDNHNFSHALVRRLPAEVVNDVLQQATATGRQAEAMARRSRLGPLGRPSTGAIATCWSPSASRSGW